MYIWRTSFPMFNNKGNKIVNKAKIKSHVISLFSHKIIIEFTQIKNGSLILCTCYIIPWKSSIELAKLLLVFKHTV